MALFAGLQALAFTDRFLLSLLATPVSQALTIDDVHMGLLQGTAFVVPFVAFTPLFGVLSDKLPPRLPVLAGLALSTLAMLGSAAADSFGALLGSRMLLGVGEAAIAPAALVQIARATSAGRGGVATAVFTTGGPLGKGLALIGGGLLLAICTRRPGPLPPWREVLLIAAALNAVAAASAWRVLAVTATKLDAANAPRPTVDRRGDATKLAATAVGGIAAVFASQTLAVWAPSLFVRSFSLTPGRAGIVTGAPLLTIGPACALASGWLMDRAKQGAPPRPAILPLLAGSLAAVAACAVGLGAAPDLFWAQVAFSTLAGALGACGLAGLRGVQVYAPDASRGRLVAAFVAAANLVGFGIGPPLVGWISSHAGHGPQDLAQALATVIAGASAAAAAIVALAWLVGVRGLAESGRKAA